MAITKGELVLVNWHGRGRFAHVDKSRINRQGVLMCRVSFPVVIWKPEHELRLAVDKEKRLV